MFVIRFQYELLQLPVEMVLEVVVALYIPLTQEILLVHPSLLLMYQYSLSSHITLQVDYLEKVEAPEENQIKLNTRLQHVNQKQKENNKLYFKLLMYKSHFTLFLLLKIPKLECVFHRGKKNAQFHNFQDVLQPFYLL